MWCIWWERNWQRFEDMKALMTSCLLLSVAPFSTGLGLGDLPLVILSPCFLVLSFVISILFVFSFLFL